MFYIAGQSPGYQVTEESSGSYTATIQLPAGCHISSPVEGQARPDAAAAKAAVALSCLQQLQGQGHLARYWSSAAMLQQAGVEGGWEGGEAGSEAVLWRCEVCGVPATSARNLEVTAHPAQTSRCIVLLEERVFLHVFHTVNITCSDCIVDAILVNVHCVVASLLSSASVLRSVVAVAQTENPVTLFQQLC